MSTATAVPKAAAGARVERFHVNDVQIEGIVTKVWTRSARSNGSADPDVYARLALYDRYAEVLPPKDNAKSDDLPRRQAHYVTILLPHGRTNDGVPISLAARNRVRVTGFVREVPYRETLRHILVRSKQIDRIQDDDDDILIQRISTYVVVQTLIRFDA